MSAQPSPVPAAERARVPGAGSRPHKAIVSVRNVDIALAIMALPIVLLLGAPVLGTIVGAGIWVVQRVLEIAIDRLARTRESVKAAIGYNLGAMVGRVWLVALSILVVGIASKREDGLAAAVFVFVAFTVYFATQLLAPVFERNSTPS